MRLDLKETLEGINIALFAMELLEKVKVKENETN